MKIVITGASGFLGKTLTRRLASEVDEVLCLGRTERSLAEIPQLENVSTQVTDYSEEHLVKAFDGYDVLIHLAGRRLTHNDDPIKVSPFTDATIGILDCLLAAAAKNNFKKVVNTSSIGVYSVSNEAPYNEQDQPLPATPYGLTKLYTEQMIDFWSRKTNIPVAHIRLTQCYGYGEKWTPVLMRFIKNALNGDKLVVNNSGFNLDQIYIEDTVEAFTLIATHEYTGSFNIGSGESLSLLNIAQTVKQVFNNSIEIDLSGDKGLPNQAQRHMSIDKAEQQLAWEPKYDLERGLSKMKERLTNLH